MRLHKSDCAARMQQALCCFVRCASQFWGCIRTKLNFLAVHPDLRHPLSLVAASTDKSVSAPAIRLVQILTVNGGIGGSKIVKPVVAWVPVNVINKVFRELSKAIQPGQTMRKVQLAIASDDDIAVLSFASSRLPNANVFRRANLPFELPSIFAVLEKFLKPALRDAVFHLKFRPLL